MAATQETLTKADIGEAWNQYLDDLIVFAMAGLDNTEVLAHMDNWQYDNTKRYEKALASHE